MVAKQHSAVMRPLPPPLLLSPSKYCFISPSLSGRWKQKYLSSFLLWWISGISCVVHGLWFSPVSDKLFLRSRGNHGGIVWFPMIWVKLYNKLVSLSACFSLSHGCICDCTSSPQEHDRLHQASPSLLTLSSLPDRYHHRRVKRSPLLTTLMCSWAKSYFELIHCKLNL